MIFKKMLSINTILENEMPPLNFSRFDDDPIALLWVVRDPNKDLGKLEKKRKMPKKGHYTWFVATLA